MRSQTAAVWEDAIIASVGGWYLEVEGRRIDLHDGEVTIGRSRGCGVVLRDPSVSRGHALLSVRGERVTLQDLRSSNGTYSNGKRLEVETALADGDRVVIGETALHLRRILPGTGPGLASSDGAAFCPACGRPVDGAAASCPSCGAGLGGGRLPRRSEAIGLGEVLPVGEVLGSASASWDQTTFRQGSAAADPSQSTAAAADPSRSTVAAADPSQSAAASSTATAAPPPGPAAAGETDPPTDPELSALLAEPPMSVRQAERTPATPLPAVSAPLVSADPPPGLIQRLAERLGLSRRG